LDRGMLRFFFLGRVLRASVAPKEFALDSSPGDDFLPAADPMEGSDGGIRWRDPMEGSDGGRCKSIIGIIPPLSGFLLATTWDGR